MNKRSTGLFKRLGIIGVPLGLLAFAGVLWHQRNYPFGHSHCCILITGSALMDYAEIHDGKFPQGEASPEASLSLLYQEHLIDSSTLRGMIVPEETTRRILESGKLLDSTSCGWHYVEGLTKADNPQLALLWCKEPLSHNGRRLESGAREVIMVDGTRGSVAAGKWAAFLTSQDELMRKRRGSDEAGRSQD